MVVILKIRAFKKPGSENPGCPTHIFNTRRIRMSKISNCQVCSVSFPVGPGCRGKYCSPECSAIGIKNRYQEIAQQQKIEKEKVYLQSPNYCANCSVILPYDRRKNKFCSQSCSATFNNQGRVKSPETKEKISKAITDLIKTGKLKIKTPIKCKQSKKISKNQKSTKSKPCKTILSHKTPETPKVKITIPQICIICNTQVVGKRMTCSRECQLERFRQASTENLRKNRHKYVGPHQRSYMERTFAEWLNSHGIRAGINGYLEQIHFKHLVDDKVKNGWIDFVFPRKKLIIELDGNHHRLRKDLDALRDKHLEAKGYRILRITHREYLRKSKMFEVINLLQDIGDWSSDTNLTK